MMLRRYGGKNVDVEIFSVIKTNLLRRGAGTEENVIRLIEQYWDMDGNLLWEYDPCPTGISDS